MWIVGDEFIRESHTTIKTLERLTLQKRSFSTNQSQRPVKMFLHNNFNVKTFYSNLATRGLNRLLYPFTEALNSCYKLPRFIIVVPDKDMITRIPTFRSSLTMGECLADLINRMSVLIQRRRQDLGDKRPGALAPDDHPTII